MRILQVIDSLNPGGAEKMAVNYANSLAKVIEFSALITTRAEGELKNQILDSVSYFFINKKRTIDIKAMIQFYSFIKKNKIEVIHAHSSSFFFASLVKMCFPKIKLVWHDHYGDSEFLEKRKSKVLEYCSKYFDLIISVNEKLANWALKNLHCKNVIYLPNFILNDNPTNSYQNETVLKGTLGKRILCLANLRPQKNHEMLLNVAIKMKEYDPEWTFHLVGKDFDDEYSSKIKSKIIEYSLQKNVYIYGTCTDIQNIIKQCNLGILTSNSEGLPLAMLEYGLYELPIVLTSVGEIPKLITSDRLGVLIPVNNVELFYKAIVSLIQNQEIRETMKCNYNLFVKNNFSEQVIIKKYMSKLTEIDV